MIATLYPNARIALAFNMLDKKHLPRHDSLMGHNCETVLAFCRTRTPRVIWFNNYLADDFTVLLYRDGQSHR